MRAVVFGAGNIGRGFLGQLLYTSAYRTTFVDVDSDLIELINRDKEYPLSIIDNEGINSHIIKNVSALSSFDEDKLGEAIKSADILATAVGVNILSRISDTIRDGLKKRFLHNSKALDILICENLADAGPYLKSLILEDVEDETFKNYIDLKVGFVETSIGRMVPIQTEEMKKDNPLRIQAEGYAYFPVDRDAFRNDLPKIEGLVPFSPFEAYFKRKLYIHNMGHALCSYLGMHKELNYIYEAMEDANIKYICFNAMLESALALNKKYGLNVYDLKLHINDLLNRFSNRALADTNARVGSDILRKIGEKDRLIGAINFCLDNDIKPAYIAIGVAAAIKAYEEENNLSFDKNSITSFLYEKSNFENKEVIQYIYECYKVLNNKKGLGELVKIANNFNGSNKAV